MKKKIISKEKKLKKKDFEERKNEGKINKMVEKERKW